MARIFISYKRVDKDKVFRIKNQIESALGEKCWIDLDGIESDAIFASKIIGAINECEIFLFMYSQAHKGIKDYENDWTIRELNFAQQKKKRIVFVNLDGSELTDWFILLFGTKQRVDGESGDALLRLFKDVKQWLGITNFAKEVKRIRIQERPKVSLTQLPFSPINSISEPTRRLETLTFAVKDVSFDMVFVEGGTFTMGATTEQGLVVLRTGKPPHLVTLSDYYIGKYEVTQELWEAVMGNNPSRFKGSAKPVEQVSWDECQEFISRLNSLLSSQLGGKYLALPTEAQWEYAARGGKKSQGYKYAGSNSISSVAWLTSAYEAFNHPDGGTNIVGTKAPNELGLYDMSGNVREWCQDWYGSYSSISQTNPIGPSSGEARVTRGGCCISNARDCRVSIRSCYIPSEGWEFIGFRLVLLS